MSPFRDSVGPKSAKVYRRRRLLALAVFVAIAAVIVLLIVRPGSSSSVESSSNVELPTDLAAETAQAAPNLSDMPACQPGQLKVTPITSDAAYAASETPEFSLSVANTGTDPCTADVGTAGMTFAVTSGSDEVWRSIDCQEDAEALAVIIDPDQPLTTDPIVWDRTRSSTETCDISRDAVGGGGASYHLRVSAAGVQGSGTAQFLLY